MRFHVSAIGALTVLFAFLTATAWALQAPSASADGRTRTEVEQRLLDQGILGVTVSVSQGVVTVEGAVASAGAKDEGGPNDRIIAYEVESRIADYAFYTIYDSVDVAVKNGEVTLTGEVMTDATARGITGVAAHVPGVVEVKNFIRTLVTSPADDAIRYQVGGWIYTNPLFKYGAPWPIHIVVEAGHVKLTGVVPSEYERQVAEMIASGIPRVTRVENRLRCFTDE